MNTTKWIKVSDSLPELKPIDLAKARCSGSLAEKLLLFNLRNLLIGKKDASEHDQSQQRQEVPATTSDQG